MDFLDKLYESDYFGIGLFAIISFLVIMFLIVLFFGKKDEKKRKLEETSKLANINNEINADNAFKDNSPSVALDVKPIEPVKNVQNDNLNVDTGLNFMPNMDIEPVAPLNFEENEVIPEEKQNVIPTIVPEVNNNNEVKPIILETPEVAPITIEPVQPIINEVTTPIINEKEEEKPIIFEKPPVIEEKVEDTTSPSFPKVLDTEVINPFSLNTAKEEEVKPIIEEKEEPIKVSPTIIEEPVIGDTYYKPVEEAPKEEIKVPSIDFDALAKSISDELDELEKSSQVKVTPMEEIEEKEEPSSLYVKEVKNKTIDLPKKIDLPIRKDE